MTNIVMATRTDSKFGKEVYFVTSFIGCATF